MNASSSAPAPLRLLLVGATGAVGQAALSLALAEPRIAEVVALTRRSLAPQAKLRNVVADLAGLPEDADCWKVDAVICALGTTMKAAGSEARFAAVDRDLPVLVAQRTRAAGATRFALNSSLGANPSGNFYLRTKAEAEEGIRKLGFPAYTIVRPSLIDVERSEVRPGERIGLLFARAFAPLIPRRYRAVKADAIAQALLTGALRDDAGERLVESEALQN
ncbi:MAG: NAD-dependent dehydratase [Betaproteobacteria bacterium HGW-Betaproteobacteria-14]|nr:MAG: NAD-dependent dehydratase [Betaproteobacteria bacterium HGW-Betaproteobacteria-14]